MQISQDSLFVIVEGRDLDARFYDRVCGSSAVIESAGYQVWLAEQLKDDSTGAVGSGKKAVLAHFDYFKATGKLTVRSSSQKHSIAFMVDRDNEDISGGRKRSSHVIYTDMFDVEAEAFVRGNDGEALAGMFSLDSASASQLAADLNGWVADLANAWREWITLCIMAKAAGAGCDVGFGRESWVNNPKYGPVEAVKLAAAEGKVATSTRRTASEYASISTRIRGRVRSCYGKGNGYRLVKGKWLAPYLVYRVKSHFGSAPVVYKGAEDYVARAYLATCDFREKWADYYRNHLEALI
ncbi:hypothetical protein [Streptomyces sp. enrichment culture]|uniref:hypothetical protein n=1 Tax=Streptomyces sp. enrichment culture TaxID=1795815 RepID=UPI003F567A0E